MFRKWQSAVPLLAAFAALLVIVLGYLAVRDRGVVQAGQDGATIPAPNELRVVKALEAGEPVTVVGLGSSVGAGATLPDPETQAPPGRMGELLRAAYPAAEVTVTNLSVNGSVASEGLRVYLEQARPLEPDVVVIAFGMNDGLPGAYSLGQTFPGGIDAVRGIVREARGDGALVVLLTTPSPHTGRTDFTLPDGLPEQHPPPAEDVVTIGGAPFSARHAEFNAAVREMADDTGVLLADVEPSWAAAVTASGEDTLFDEEEFVHPNLAGHQASYWPAFDDVMAQIARR